MRHLPRCEKTEGAEETQSDEGELRHRPQTAEPAPEAEKVQLREIQAHWCQQSLTESEAEQQHDVMARFSGASCHAPKQCAAAHRPYRWEGEQGSRERNGSPLSCISQPRSAYTLLSR